MALVNALETTIDAAAAAHPNPGVRTFQRLNRAGVRARSRELLELDVDAGNWLPLDTMSANFDNICRRAGAVADAARVVSQRRERDQPHGRRRSQGAGRSIRSTRNPSYISQHPWDHVDGAPFGTRGGMVVDHVFPADGEYVFGVALNSGDGARYEDIDISIDGERVALLRVRDRAGGRRGRPRRGRHPDRADPRQGRPAQGRGGVRERLEGPYEDLIRPHDWSYAGGGSGGGGITNLPHLRDLIISGPFKTTGVSETPARQKIFTCRPTSGDEELRCARTIVTKLAGEAYRRPVTLREVDRLMPFYEKGADAGTASRAASARRSRRFSRARISSSGSSASRRRRKPGTTYRVADLDLASRLSFFLWGTPPDQELLPAATQGRLSTPLGLERQVKRMLADPRAEALGHALRRAVAAPAGRRQGPPGSELLSELRRQPRRAHAAGNDPVLQHAGARRPQRARPAIAPTSPFINERLARHYGIPGVAGNEFRKVQYPDDTRRGLLGQGSMLVQTSLANRTSPVLRGKWVMEVLLGTPPPPPPPDVPDARGDGRGEGRPDADDARAHGDASRESDVQRVPPLHGSDRPGARQLRRHRQVARARERHAARHARRLLRRHRRCRRPRSCRRRC